MSARVKPAGIVALAIYSALLGLACLPIGCTSAFIGGLPGAGALSVIGFLITALGVFLLVSAYGLWTLQPWGRTYTWWLYLANIPLGVMAIFALFPGQQMSVANTILQLIGIGIDLVVLVYLSSPEVEELFGRSDHGPLPYFARREPH